MPILTLPEIAFNTVKQLDHAALLHNAAVAGYAVLPSALLCILAFKGEYNLPEFVFDFKHLSAMAMVGLDHRQFREKLYRKGKFRPWMNRFDQMQIGTKGQFLSRLDYIHKEPLRRGLASRPEDWPFSSASDWLEDRNGIIEVTKKFFWAELI